ncbi:glycoside hydrolase superfamily [Massariosphaeria phaeospora]|uniref:Glycoside hydrolase superfamily n=1 Tax=Massariosphaeria phaeospora TaxID=100035 RepID=A0A7C8M520_9PLEO|nr:glycoside hydrolase superfamily [Massariosphaeria phaeospora]
MSSFTRVAAVAAGLFASVYATFDAASSKNVAIDDSVVIVNIAFINQFPKFEGDYPGSNFANACGEEMYILPDGTTSKRSNCPSIGDGIRFATKSRSILLNFSGAPSDRKHLNGLPTVNHDRSVTRQSMGLNLDIESFMAPAPFPEYMYANYDAFVSHLKDNLFPTGPGQYYISGAPQCVIPDARLANAISKSHFDFIFVQFYNTRQCSARAGYNGLAGTATGFTFDGWVAWLKANSANQCGKIFLGIANELIAYISNKHSDIFSGVMMWEATVSARNKICDKGYSTWIKDILTRKNGGTAFIGSQRFMWS